MLQHHDCGRSVKRLAMVVVFVLLCAGTSWPADLQEEPGNPGYGVNLFIQKGCIRCHSIWESAHKRGPNLASVGMGRNLYELCASIWSHWSQMNAAREQEKVAPITLSPSEIRDIIAYLYYLNYYKEPGDKLVGKEIFSDRNCSQCHAVDPTSAEGKSGPSVYRMQDFHGPISLVVALWNHGGSMLQRMEQQHISWPQLQGKEVAQLVSYIQSVTGEARDPQTRLPGDPLRGRELFTSWSCAGCHEPTDGSGIGPNLAASGVAASLSSLVASLWNHYPKMAQAMSSTGVSRARMTTRDMEDLMAYVYWLKAYGLEGNSATGRDLYQTKHCASCHSPSSNEMASAPPLVGSNATRSPYTMMAAIWNHGPKMQSRLQQRNITWPTLTGDEMRNLIAFFQTPPPRTSN